MEQSRFTEKERKELLEIARAAIIGREIPLAKIRKKAGVFVSVYVDGELHGCIGNLQAGDVVELVIDNAQNAAFRDSRFSKLTNSEMGKMKININVLSDPKEISYENNNDLIKKIKGKGVILSFGYHKATFLPSVWDQLPEAEEFLGHLCMKAGLDMDEWKKGALKVQVYQSEEWGE